MSGKYPSFELFLKLWKEVDRYTEESRRVNTAAALLFNSTSEEAPVEIGGFLLGAYLTLLDSLFDSTANWCSYYYFDCDNGNAPKEVTINGDEYQMDSLEKLYLVLTR